MKTRIKFKLSIIAAILLITNMLLNITAINAATSNDIIYKDKNCNITFKINSEWDTGFEAQIIFSNTSKQLIKDCNITFDLPYEINTMWDGEIINHKGNSYTIKHNNIIMK